MSVKIEILDYQYSGSNINWEKSVIGELDVTDHSDFPLAMTFQISDIKDLTSTSGDYSKTFKIPATKNNNKLLKHSYIANIDTDVNLTENKKCRILINNLYSLKGLIKITGIGGYGETPSYYNCVFFGNNISWADDLSNKYMDVIDWGANSKDLAYNKTNIMATWQHEDCDAAAAASDPPIVYPITSYGKYNSDGEPRTIQLLDTAYDYNQTGTVAKIGYYGFFNTVGSYGTPLPSPDWRPAIFIKDTLEKIFAKAGDGYKINSTFMETDMFKKLVWLLPNFKYNNPEEKYDEFSVESDFTNGVSMSATGTGFGVITENGIQRLYNGSLEQDEGNYYWNGAGRKLLDIDGATNLNVTLDEGSYVDSANHYITIGEYGYYDITLNGIQSKIARAYKGGSDDVLINTIHARINLEVQTAGQSSWNIIDLSNYIHTINQDVDSNTDASTSYANMPSIDMQGLWLNKNDKVRITLGTRLYCSQRSWQQFLVWIFFKAGSSSNFNIQINPNRVEYGQTYDLEEVINTDYKQIDFVKGVAHAFNLQISTDESARVVSIEPFDTFYKDYAHAIDWTYKLDRSKQIEDKWIKSDLKRDVIFKYKSDSKDKKVEARGEQYWDGIKDEYPYQETLPKTFEKGESKYENPFFAGTYNAKDQDSTGTPAGVKLDTAYSACLWEEDVSANNSSRPDKGFEFLPRLLYWNKYSPPTVAEDIKLAKVQTWESEFGFILASASNLSITSNIYPQATSINRDSISSPILSYGNVNIKDYNDATGVYASSVAGKGLFETYYKTMFEMLKAKPRLRTIYVDLKVKDILDLDFTKLINIDGVYWRINKVVDYQPNKNQSTKVELIEWLQLGTFAATAPPFDGDTEWGGWNGQDGAVDDDPFDGQG